MAQVSQIAVLDGAATPVSHVFKRMPSLLPNVVAFRDSTAGLIVAQRTTLTGSYRPAASNNDGAKRVWNVSFPEYDSVTKKVIATGRLKIEALTPDALTSATKANMAAFLKNFSGCAEVQGELTNDDPII